jgi:hypothetical protein
MTIPALFLLITDVEGSEFGIPNANVKKLAYNGCFVNAAKPILRRKWAFSFEHWSIARQLSVTTSKFSLFQRPHSPTAQPGF